MSIVKIVDTYFRSPDYESSEKWISLLQYRNTEKQKSNQMNEILKIV